MSAEHPLAGAKHVTADELKDQPLLIPGRDSVKNEIANWFGGYFESLNVIATYDLIYNAAMLAKAYGAVVLSMEHGMFCKSMKFIPLEPEIMTGAVLVWKKGQIMSTPVRYFTEYLKNKRIDKVGNE